MWRCISKNAALFNVQEERSLCKLQPTSKYAEQSKKEALNGTAENRCKDHKSKEPLLCPDCGWKRFALYAIPLLLYVPWAYNKMRCNPKCCPQSSCCSKVSCLQKQNVNSVAMSTKWKESYQKKQNECKNNKKGCQDEWK